MDYMKRALALGKRARGLSSPNPPVGAVVVKDGQIVGEGYTLPPGQGHAEVVALKQAGERARGAVLYTTLEPCNHHGRVAPCTPAIIQAGITEVHMAVVDPNPLVNGRGRGALEAAGIRCVVGEHQEEALELNEAFIKHITTGLPFVTAKFAMSLDGKIATFTGDSRWITGQRARQYVHHLRSISDVVMVGVNTAITDDPQLTARDARGRPLGRQPLRVVVDSQGRLPASARMLREPGRTLIATVEGRPWGQGESPERVEVLGLPALDGQVDLRALLHALGKRELISVLVEGGSALLGTLFDLGLVDKVMAFIAPVIVGGRGAPTAVAGRGVERMAEALRLRKVRVRRLGDDLMVVGYPDRRPMASG